MAFAPWKSQQSQENWSMKKDLKKLRQSIAEKKAAGLAKNTELNALLAKDDATAEEQARITALDAEVTQLEADVSAINADIEAEEKRIKRSTIFAPSAPAGSGARSDEPNPETTGGFRNLCEFAYAVRRSVTGGGVDTRLAAPSNYQQNQGAANEGVLVPVQFREDIWALAFDPSDLLGMVTPEPTNSNAISIPKDETTPWGSTGVQAYWRAEAGQMTASKWTPTNTMVQLHELYAFVLATQELLDDAPRLQDRLTMQAARAIRWTASDAIMWGDGNGKPLGFMNAACLVTQNKDGSQASNTISTTNILNMSSRLLRYGIGKPTWLANADTEPQLAALTIGNIPFFLPNSQPGASPVYEGTVRGRPLMFTEHCKSLTNKGDIVIADLSGYCLATKQGGGVDFAASIHLFFDYNIQAFRWTFRLGGQPYLSAAVSPANGSNTKSHFVALQAR
jgi:HK97 family phage major capsid protein